MSERGRTAAIFMNPLPVFLQKRKIFFLFDLFRLKKGADYETHCYVF